MNNDLYFDYISKKIALLNSEVNASNSLNLHDKSIFLEDIIANLLNALYDISLKNTNFNLCNYPSIDLADNNSRIAVQVTTDVGRSKIQNTLNKFFENKLDKNFDSLYIVVFNTHSYNNNPFIVQDESIFSREKNLLTLDELYKLIRYASIDKMEKIYNYFKLIFEEKIYDPSWAIRVSSESINNLGKRYNRDIPIHTNEDTKIELFYNLQECKNNILHNINEIIILIENENIKCNLNIDSIENNFNSSNYEKIINEINLLKEQVIDKYNKSTDNKQNHNDYGKLYKFKNSFNKVYDTIIDLKELYFSKILIMSGKAGIGKSHTVGNYIYNNYCTKDIPSIFLLGRDFSLDEKAEIQFCKNCGGRNNFEEILMYLNNMGILRNIQIPIIIDGINESRCKNIWKNNLLNITKLICKYSNIKLVITVRDTYSSVCIPEELDNNKCVIKKTHHGFSSNTFAAIKQFFDFYNLNVPVYKVINNEFKNPLFLVQYCELLSNRNFDLEDDQYSNFLIVFEKFIEYINNDFNRKNDALFNLGIISSIIDSYIEIFLKNNEPPKSEDFSSMVSNITSRSGIDYIYTINYLLENNLFFIEKHLNVETVNFTYERYLKICCAKYLLKKYNNLDEIKNSINNGELKDYIEYSDKFDEGIVEELINIIQLKYSYDFLSLMDFDFSKINYYIKYNYIKSIKWYKGQYNISTIEENIKKLLAEEEYYYDIIDTMISVSYIPDNPFNILYISKSLLDLSMAERDYKWSINIDEYYNCYENNALDSIFEYCLENGNKYLNDEQIYLISILLCWMLSSSNRHIRDISTKCLTLLLLNHNDINIKIIDYFKDINDMYILERIVAASYGNIMRSSKNDNINELSEKIYNLIYPKKGTVDNIVIKTYGLKLFKHLKTKYNIKLYDNIGKENKSKWYDSLPTNDEIDKYDFSFEELKEDKRKYENHTIIHSMVTEYGRGTSAYGDFGRYTMEHYLKPFEYIFNDVQLLANAATKRVFDYGYNYELFGNYDRNVKANESRHYHLRERIGKKYQWIAMYELLSRLYDNFEPHLDVYSDDIIDLKNKKYFDKNHIETKEQTKIEYTTYTAEENFNNVFSIDTTNFLRKQNDNIKYINFNLEKETENISEKFIKDVNGKKYITLFSLDGKQDRDFYLTNVDRNEFSLVYTALVYKSKNALLSSNFKEYVLGTYNEEYNIQLYDIPYSEEYILENNRKFKDQNFEASYKTCYDEYIWEKTNDESIENSIKVVLPQKWIIDEFNLVQRKEGNWYQNDNLICFQPNINEGNQELLINYDTFVSYLKRNKLNICWVVFYEKQHNLNFYNCRKIYYYDYKSNKFEEDTFEEKSGDLPFR